MMDIIYTEQHVNHVAKIAILAFHLQYVILAILDIIYQVHLVINVVQIAISAKPQLLIAYLVMMDIIYLVQHAIHVVQIALLV